MFRFVFRSVPLPGITPGLAATHEHELRDLTFVVIYGGYRSSLGVAQGFEFDSVRWKRVRPNINTNL
jgi:hypothetical protein